MAAVINLLPSQPAPSVTHVRRNHTQTMEAHLTMNNTYLRIVLLFTIATMLMAPIAAGQTPLQIGSPNTATADPPQARPNTTPCVVQLFSNLGPVNANANLFSFAPPAGCPPPWAKVIISADFSVPPGRGGDRTTTIFIGATNVLYNTSPLPLVNLGQTWHVERDLTDYSQLLSTPHAGQVQFQPTPDLPSLPRASLSCSFPLQARRQPASRPMSCCLSHWIPFWADRFRSPQPIRSAGPLPCPPTCSAPL